MDKISVYEWFTSYYISSFKRKELQIFYDQIWNNLFSIR